MSQLCYLWAKLFSYPVFYRCHEILYYLSLRGMGVLNDRSSFISGEAHFLKSDIIKKDGVFVDVGAHHGEYSLLLREQFSNARIIAFEPHPKTFKRLEENLKSYNVETINKAVGAVCGAALLYDHENSGTEQASLYSESHQISGLTNSAIQQEIQVTSLDDFSPLKISLFLYSNSIPKATNSSVLKAQKT